MSSPHTHNHVGASPILRLTDPPHLLRIARNEEFQLNSLHSGITTFFLPGVERSGGESPSAWPTTSWATRCCCSPSPRPLWGSSSSRSSRSDGGGGGWGGRGLGGGRGGVVGGARGGVKKELEKERGDRKREGKGGQACFDHQTCFGPP